VAAHVSRETHDTGGRHAAIVGVYCDAVHDGRPSITALAAARHRATHQVLEGGVVFADPIAVRLVGESVSELRSAAAAHPDRRPMRWFICARARFADDCLTSAVRSGVEQLVVLGAGLDTVGYRRRLAGLRIVEVDHPATQRWKLGLLADAGIDPTPVAHHSVDFEREDLTAVLNAAIEPEAPVLVWWLGVTPYLTVNAVRSTIRALGRLSQVALILDHASPVADADPVRRPGLERRRQRLARLGEPWLAEFRPDDLSAELRAAGFEHTVAVDERAVIRLALTGMRDTARPLLGLEPAGEDGARSHLMMARRGLADWPSQ
jgi:methyltransferase (TIGR00027 family)